MTRSLFAAAGLAGVAVLAGMFAVSASAAPVATVDGPKSPIVKVDMDRCARVRHECERAFPGMGERWRRCVRERDCRL